MAVTHAGEISSDVQVDALCRGAALLSREENRIAARALLWAAVAIDPQNFVAHRRLAAALLNGEDVDAAAEEYARFIELLLKENDVRRAAAELAYARSFVGDVPQLHAAATHLVPLGEIAESLESAPARSTPPLALAEYAATRSSSRAVNDSGPSVRVRSRHQRRPWYRRWAPEVGLGEYILVLSLVTAAALAAFALVGFR